MSRSRLIFHSRLGTPTPTPAVTFDTRFGITDTTTGWTDFPLLAGRHYIFCNSARPDDTGDGLTHATGKKTLKAAALLRQSTSPNDTILLAEGGTYTDDGTYLVYSTSGASLLNPSMVLSYDPNDATNTTKYGRALGANRPKINHAYDGSAYGASSFTPSARTDNYGWSGLEFVGQFLSSLLPGDGNTSDIGVTHNGTTGFIFQNFLLQDCGIIVQPSTSSDSATWGSTGRITRASGGGEWRINGNKSWLYVEGMNDLIVEDFAPVNAGFKRNGNRDDNLNAGGAYHLSHGIYLATYTQGTIVRRGFGIDPAQDTYSFRGSFTGGGLTSLDSPIFMTFSGYSGNVSEAPNGSVAVCVDWAAVGGGDISVSPGDRGGEPAGGIFGIRDAISPSLIQHGVIVDSPKFSSGTDVLEAAANDLATGKFVSVTIDNVRSYHGASVVSGSTSGINPTQITITFTNCILDASVSGGTNSVYSAPPAGNKTRDQLLTQLLTDAGVTPGANYAARKIQLKNLLWEYPHLAGEFAKAWNTLAQAVHGLTPTSHPATTAPNVSSLPAPRAFFT